MPELSRAQLVLLELAAAAAVCGVAARGVWLIVGVAVGAVLLLLALLPVGGRWLYQLALSYLALRRRRSRVRGPGLQTMLGGYRVVTVPAGRHTRGRAEDDSGLGAVCVGSSWTVPLALGPDSDDAPVPVAELAGLLRVEEVRLSSVRLVTVTSSASGGGAHAARLAARYCLLSLDIAADAAAVAERGGNGAAVAQILRRCAVRAEQVLSARGVVVRRLDERGVTELFGTLFGPATTRADGSIPPTVESWRDIRVAGVWSTTWAVTGEDPDTVPGRLAGLVESLPTPHAVTSLVLRPRPRGGVDRTLLLRVSGPSGLPDHSVHEALATRARAAGLVLQRLDGEQGVLLTASMPVGVGALR